MSRREANPVDVTMLAGLLHETAEHHAARDDLPGRCGSREQGGRGEHPTVGRFEVDVSNARRLDRVNTDTEGPPNMRATPNRAPSTAP